MSLTKILEPLYSWEIYIFKTISSVYRNIFEKDLIKVILHSWSRVQILTKSRLFISKKIVKPKPKEPVNICYTLFHKNIVESMKPLFF